MSNLLQDQDLLFYLPYCVFIHNSFLVDLFDRHLLTC